MAIRSHITDPATGRKTNVINKDNISSIAVATQQLKEYTNKLTFFTDANGSNDMNIGVAFGAAPVGVYDGGDRTQWTVTTPVGGAGDFLETSIVHAKNAIITVTNNAAINALDTITITTSVTGATVLTEGTEWDKLANAALTIDSIATAIDALSHMASADDGATIANMYTTNTEDIETIAFSGAGMTQSAQCIDATPSGNNDTLQFDKGSDLDLTGYVSITGYIYITGWGAGQGVNLYGWDVGASTQLGNTVNIGNYVDTSSEDIWQKFTISLVDMGISGLSSTFDALRMTTISTGVSPNYYIDYIQVEQVGTVDPTAFTVKPDKGTWLHVSDLVFSIADALDTALANNSMPSLSYDKILDVTKLANGITYQLIKNGKIVDVITVTNIGDWLQYPLVTISEAICDGTNTFIKISVKFVEPAILKEEDDDEMRIIISDSLSGLLFFRTCVGAKVEQRE